MSILNSNIEKKGVRFTNFIYDENKYYFLFISELKAYGIGHFFKEALSKILGKKKKEIEFISIAPDVFEQYNYENLIILNKSKKNENKRKKHDSFIKKVSNNSYINEMIDEILSNQEELFLYMFESSPFMTLNKKERVTLIGPDYDIVSTLSNKISLYEIFSNIVPMAPFEIGKGFDELLTKSEKLLKKPEDNIFISLEKSAAGANSIITNNTQNIVDKFGENIDSNFLITKFIPHLSDPTTLGVVINEDEVFVSGVADQTIDGTKFRGSTFPSKASPKVQEEIIRQTRVVGKEMARLGYRGIFGCDFIVTDMDEVFFIETNPRKQGTTMEFCCTLKNMIPKNAPNLPELEFYAVTQSKKAPNLVEPDFLNTNIFWKTYNCKITNKLITHSYLPQNNDEIAIFDNVSQNKTKKEFMILEHIGQDFFVNEGSFLGRVVATGKSFKDVEDGIEIGKKIINYTVKEHIEDDFVLDEKCYSCKYYNL